MVSSGIYALENCFNGKVYIGSSSAIKSRRYNHFNDLLKNKHFNKHLQASYNKYGLKNFVFRILEEVKDLSKLILREQYWIDLFIVKDGCVYNKTKCAEPWRGQRISPVQRKKISITLKRKGIVPPSRKGIGWGFCRLFCSRGHYKSSKNLIKNSNMCKECQRVRSQEFRRRRKV